MVIVAIMNEGHILAGGKIAQAVVELLIPNWANHVKAHFLR